MVSGANCGFQMLPPKSPNFLQVELIYRLEILLQGRCYWAAGQWDYFCNQILTAKLDAKQPEIVEPDVSDLAAA